MTKPKYKPTTTLKIDMNIIQRSINNLKPYPNNARTHSKKHIKQIAESILTFGYLNSSAEILPNLAVSLDDMAIDDVVKNNGEFVTVTAIYNWEPIFPDILPSFVSGNSLDLSFDLETSYTMRAIQ